jgi:hypothetical protein
MYAVWTHPTRSYALTCLCDVLSVNSTQGKDTEPKEPHQDFETKEDHWQRSMHFGDRVLAEGNSREIITKQTNKIAK